MELNYIQEDLLGLLYAVPIGGLANYIFCKCRRKQREKMARIWLIRGGYSLSGIFYLITAYAFMIVTERMFYNGEPVIQKFFHAPQCIIFGCLFFAFIGCCFLGYDFYIRLMKCTKTKK